MVIQKKIMIDFGVRLIADSVNILKIAEMFNQSIQCIENVKNNKSYVNV